MKQVSKFLLSLAFGMGLVASNGMLMAASSNVPGGPAIPVEAKPASSAASEGAEPEIDEEAMDVFEALLSLGQIKKDITTLRQTFTPSPGKKSISEQFNEQLEIFNKVDARDVNAKTRSLIKLLFIAFGPLKRMTNVTAKSTALVNISIKGIAETTGLESKLTSVTTGIKGLATLTKTADSMVKSLDQAVKKTLDAVRDADALKAAKESGGALEAPKHTASDAPVEQVDLSGF